MKGQFEFNEDVGGLFINIIACYLIVLFTLGIGTPWAFCKIQRWRAENTTIEGKKIKFIGLNYYLNVAKNTPDKFNDIGFNNFINGFQNSH